MYTEAKKLHIIEEVLRTNDDAALTELETIVNRSAKASNKKSWSAHEMLGRWTPKDAKLIEKAIEDGCEQINEDDWK